MAGFGLADLLQNGSPANMLGQGSAPWHQRITPHAGQPPTQPTSPWMPSNVQPDYNAAPNARVYTPEDVHSRMQNPPMAQSEHQRSDTEGMGDLSRLFVGGMGGLADFLRMREQLPRMQQLPQPYANPSLDPFE